MSLYKKLFNKNKNCDFLLKILNLTDLWEKARFRDCYLDTTGTKITLLTRGGKEAMIDCTQINNEIRKNIYYVKDYDDDFDSTYKYFEFKVPEEYKSKTKSLAPSANELSLKEKFDSAINAIQNPTDNSDLKKRVMSTGQEIFDKINEGNSIIEV